MGKAARNIVGYGLALPTGGLSLGITTKAEKKIKPNIDVDINDGVEELKTLSEKNKKNRAKLLYTSGGYSGDEVLSVYDGRKNLLGN